MQSINYCLARNISHNYTLKNRLRGFYKTPLVPVFESLFERVLFETLFQVAFTDFLIRIEKNLKTAFFGLYIYRNGNSIS